MFPSLSTQHVVSVTGNRATGKSHAIQAMDGNENAPSLKAQRRTAHNFFFTEEYVMLGKILTSVRILRLLAGAFFLCICAFALITEVFQDNAQIAPSTATAGIPIAPPTKVPPTQRPTTTPKPENLSKPVSSPTPRISTSAYRKGLAVVFDNCINSLNMYALAAEAAAENVTLILNDEWRMDMAIALVGVEGCGENLQERRLVPPEYEKVDKYLVEAGGYYILAVEYTIKGIDDLDGDYLHKAADYIEEAGALVRKASDSLPD